MTLLKQSRKLSVFQRRQPPPHPLPSLQQSRRYFCAEKVTGLRLLFSHGQEGQPGYIYFHQYAS